MEALEQNLGGFTFQNCLRNQLLEAKGVKFPHVKKTGTTIAGIVFKNGVVLGADTRATAGPIVADKNCAKIHYIAPNIYCCGAGVSADTENVTGLVSSNLELLRLNTGTHSRVITAMTHFKRHLFKYQGHVTAALVLGGVDVTGPSLFMIYPHGSTDKLPFVTMGSGSLAAMSVFESRFREDMEEKEAIDLVEAAIKAGIFNDMGSGSNVDINVITREGVRVLRNYATPNPRLYTRQRPKDFPRGTTEYLAETIRPVVEIASVQEIQAEAMQV